MKIGILGDTHWGCRNDLALFYTHFEKFYDDMIKQLLEEGVTDLFQLGDLFDRRKYINFRTLSESKRILFDKLAQCGIRLHVLVGNHDIHMRESIDINSPNLVLGEYNNVIVYQTPSTVTLDNTTIDIVPWICRDNEKDVLDFISKSKSDMCFGHFEIAGFAMYRGLDSQEGLSAEMFEKYALVCSGHYHTKSKKSNIVYVGTPYEMNWQDYNDPRGFHIFDTNTISLEFYQNPHTIFVRIDYDDTKPLTDLNSLELVGKFVKVVVTNKTDLYKFDNYIGRVYNSGAYEVKVIEDMSEFSEGDIGEEIDLEDTMDVLSNYIDSIETTADKEKIKNFMKTLYIEAINQEIE